jgi:hypothetical protein
MDKDGQCGQQHDEKRCSDSRVAEAAPDESFDQDRDGGQIDDGNLDGSSAIQTWLTFA